MAQQVALVTGAGRGIGREVAAQLAAQGYDVVVAARDGAAAEQVAAGIRGRGVALDVTDAAQVAAVVGGLDRLDVLVNNAAAFADWGETALTADLDALDRTWQTNVVGPWRLVQAAAPLLERSDHPRVVNVGSGSGSHGDEQFGLAAGPGMAGYAVTKAALGALTRKIATAMPHARVNAVDPGLTATAPGMEEMGARPVAEGAGSVVWAATLPPDGPTGGFFRDGRPHPW
jgi:NAD(P)-dependent dehydrogenase (short-subunit alcohol dehydrogenase family)